jgi:hypothetical protein
VDDQRDARANRWVKAGNGLVIEQVLRVPLPAFGGIGNAEDHRRVQDRGSIDEAAEALPRLP